MGVVYVLLKCGSLRQVSCEWDGEIVIQSELLLLLKSKNYLHVSDNLCSRIYLSTKIVMQIQ